MGRVGFKTQGEPSERRRYCIPAGGDELSKPLGPRASCPRLPARASCPRSQGSVIGSSKGETPAPKFAQPRQAAALHEIAIEVGDVEDVFVEESLEGIQVLFDRQPRPQMGLVREVLPSHVAGVAAEGHLADRLDAEERDGGPVRVAAELVVWDQPFAGDDHPLRGPGQLQVGDGHAADAAVAVDVRLMDMDGGDVRIERRQCDERPPGERARNHLGSAFRQGVGPEHGPRREGTARPSPRPEGARRVHSSSIRTPRPCRTRAPAGRVATSPRASSPTT